MRQRAGHVLVLLQALGVEGLIVRRRQVAGEACGGEDGALVERVEAAAQGLGVGGVVSLVAQKGGELGDGERRLVGGGGAAALADDGDDIGPGLQVAEVADELVELELARLVRVKAGELLLGHGALGRHIKPVEEGPDLLEGERAGVVAVGCAPPAKRNDEEEASRVGRTGRGAGDACARCGRGEERRGGTH